MEITGQSAPLICTSIENSHNEHFFFFFKFDATHPVLITSHFSFLSNRCTYITHKANQPQTVQSEIVIFMTVVYFHILGYTNSLTSTFGISSSYCHCLSFKITENFPHFSLTSMVRHHVPCSGPITTVMWRLHVFEQGGMLSSKSITWLQHTCLCPIRGFSWATCCISYHLQLCCHS